MRVFDQTGRWWLIAATFLALQAPLPALGVYYPPGFNDQLVVSGLNIPTAFAFVPGGLILVAEQAGAIRVVDDGVLLPDPAIVIDVEPYDEQGLLGLAVSPDYPSSPFVYVFYTPYTGQTEGNANRVSRFTIDGLTIPPQSEVILLDNIPAGLGFHLGGCLRFGLDGNLYISTGDTGWATPYPQDLTLLQGKLLRIRPNGTIPTDNPFYNTPGARKEIFQWGLRNPFRFSIQPGTGVPFIADVGAVDWEEVDTGPPGANFGWPECEGNCVPHNPAFADPLWAYSHFGDSAAIVGNVFCEGNHFPAEYTGNYFFFDHSRGYLGRMVLTANNQVSSVTFPFIETESQGWGSGPVDLAEGPDGAFYYSTYVPGTIRRIFYTGEGNRNPSARASASPTAGYPPLVVHFDGSSSFDVDGDPLTYDWDFGDNRPHSSLVSPFHSYQSEGTFLARVTVFDGQGGSDTSQPITITVGNLPPNLTITSPPNGAYYVVNSTVFFAGTGSDPEDGAIPGNRLHWKVDLHHLNHIHPVILDQVGSSGSFTAGSHGEDPHDVFYRIHLSATDLEGLEGEKTVDIHLVAAADAPSADAIQNDLSLSVAPNPVRSGAEIRFALPQAAEVLLTLHDATGRRIETLQSGIMSAGAHAVLWDPSRSRAPGVPPPAPGVYFVRLSTATTQRSISFVWVR